MLCDIVESEAIEEVARVLEARPVAVVETIGVVCWGSSLEGARENTIVLAIPFESVETTGVSCWVVWLEIAWEGTAALDSETVDSAGATVLVCPAICVGPIEAVAVLVTTEIVPLSSVTVTVAADPDAIMLAGTWGP